MLHLEGLKWQPVTGPKYRRTLGLQDHLGGSMVLCPTPQAVAGARAMEGGPEGIFEFTSQLWVGALESLQVDVVSEEEVRISAVFEVLNL